MYWSAPGAFCQVESGFIADCAATDQLPIRPIKQTQGAEQGAQVLSQADLSLKDDAIFCFRSRTGKEDRRISSVGYDPDALRGNSGTSKCSATTVDAAQ